MPEKSPPIDVLEFVERLVDLRIQVGNIHRLLSRVEGHAQDLVGVDLRGELHVADDGAPSLVPPDSAT